MRNLTKIPRRIRITQPTTARFRVDYDMQGALAAGLQMKLVVYFEANVVDDYHDVIIITSEEGFRFNLKVEALKPQPFINFPNFLDLGYCQINKSKEGKLAFTNEGRKEGAITLKNDKLKFEPSNNITVQPGQTQQVIVRYQTN